MMHTFNIAAPFAFSAGFLFFLYAEIHFRMKGIPNLLFKKEPEIVFDLPYRALKGNSVPLFLFIKDANRYPVELISLKIQIKGEPPNNFNSFRIALNKPISDPFHWESFEIPSNKFPIEGTYQIQVELEYQVGGKHRKLIQDNYRGIPHSPFQLFISTDPLPRLPGWQWGDLHIHSNFTSDQLEFGAPVEATIQAARTTGLQFVAITDHSYDLDDETDNYLKHHPEFPKWNAFLKQISTLQKKFPRFGIIAGEEISLGNSQNQNVHCLLLGDSQLFPGEGDGGEQLFRNQPNVMLQDVLKEKAKHSVVIAAHPRVKPPLSQKLILNRGFWQWRDLVSEGVEHWQILNGQMDRIFWKSLQLWIQALLEGKKIGIIAGTDAHGNFNCYRQVQIPFLKLKYSRKFLLGKVRTGLKIEGEMNSEALLNALHSKRVIISTGPLLEMEIQTENRSYAIGETVSATRGKSIVVRVISSPEFGVIREIKLITGDILQKKETFQIIPARQPYNFEVKIPFPGGKQRGYIRGEVISGDDEARFYAFSNPIWFKS